MKIENEEDIARVTSRFGFMDHNPEKRANSQTNRDENQ